MKYTLQINATAKVSTPFWSYEHREDMPEAPHQYNRQFDFDELADTVVMSHALRDIAFDVSVNGGEKIDCYSIGDEEDGYFRVYFEGVCEGDGHDSNESCMMLIAIAIGIESAAQRPTGYLTEELALVGGLK